MQTIVRMPPSPQGYASDDSSPPPGRPAVFVIDPDAAIRDWMCELGKRAGWHVRTFVNAGDFLVAAPDDGPCCLVLDVRLPDISGLELQALIASERTNLPFIFMTERPDIQTGVRAIKAGALEFLVRPVEEGDILEAIEVAIERSRLACAERREIRELRGRFQALSERERQVMKLVVSGLMNKQIAYELRISEITVKAHRGRVMQKMRARSLADLVKFGARLGLP